MAELSKDTVRPESPQPTAAELRAQADAMEREAATANKGKVFVSKGTGLAFIHEGNIYNNNHLEYYRELSDAEVQALRAIPEFADNLDRVRGSK